MRVGVLAAGLLLLVVGCATRPYSYVPIDEVGFRERAQTQREGTLQVTAAVPDREESKRLFGIDVYARGIQPIWLEVENRGRERVRFAPVGTDPLYFSPLEVAYMHRSQFSKQGHLDMEARFHEIAMPRQIWPGETRSGFVFTHVEPGTKAFNVDLFSSGGQDSGFTFFIEVPGFLPDHAEIDFEGLYEPGEIEDFDVAGFRAALDGFGCCATDQEGTQQGLPLNVVFVGEGNDVLQALLRAGWYERTRAVQAEVVAREQHFRGRPPDAVFRRKRGRSDRNELRAWLAPARVNGKPVWVAQITHYIGRRTELGRALLDPRLDPDLDDARFYVLQNLWYSQGLDRFAWQNTGRAVDIDEGSSDWKGVAYFTDGFRVVMWPSGPPVSLLETVQLDWSEPPPIRGSER
ncbi:MAG: LssY C-terminal domain-containing protein [Myxococcota bacterium]|nr:LssY C-terminal domain-containing protein [Myxococcota bacterium]